jgi:hypothetical protein
MSQFEFLTPKAFANFSPGFERSEYPSMKPGRVKRNSGLIGSPFYSSFHSFS